MLLKCFWLALTPTKRDSARSIGTFFDQWFMIFATGSWVNRSPALFAIVLFRQNYIYYTSLVNLKCCSICLYLWNCITTFSRCQYIKKITYLKTRDVSAEKWRKFTATSLSLTFIAHLVIQNIWLHFDPFINVSMLQLYKSSRYCRNVTLLVRKSNTSGALFHVK